MKTIAEQIKWDLETNGDLAIRGKKGNLIYFEPSNGFWAKYEYDSKGNEIYFGSSDGRWAKREYDSQGNVIYFEESTGAIWDNREQRNRNRWCKI